MPATKPRQRSYKNAPFDLPPDLQREFDRAAKRLRIPKTQLLSMALAKGLPIVREFLVLDKSAASQPTTEGSVAK